MAWAYAADSAQATHVGYRRSHVVCETWLLLYTDDKLDIYIYILRVNMDILLLGLLNPTCC